VRGVEFGHGFRLLDLATVGSTNDVLRGLAEAGEPAGLLVRAERQTAGRGRHGRSWQSPPGNLYASLLLRPTRPSAEIASLSLVAALALAEGIERVSSGRIAPRLKWPNDLQVEGAKLAGILLEMGPDGKGGCGWLIMGIGVNIAWAPSVDLPYRATCLNALGSSATPRRLLAALAATLRPRLDHWDREGFAGLREDWLARAVGRGSPAALRVGDRAVRGKLVDVDDAGALRLEQADGTLATYSAGEIVLG
jgi:BirA family biotin operon repressor/biotin-[acetyl-CoA-carboxylase] ligase